MTKTTNITPDTEQLNPISPDGSVPGSAYLEHLNNLNALRYLCYGEQVESEQSPVPTPAP